MAVHIWCWPTSVATIPDGPAVAAVRRPARRRHRDARGAGLDPGPDPSAGRSRKRGRRACGRPDRRTPRRGVPPGDPRGASHRVARRGAHTGAASPHRTDVARGGVLRRVPRVARGHRAGSHGRAAPIGAVPSAAQQVACGERDRRGRRAGRRGCCVFPSSAADRLLRLRRAPARRPPRRGSPPAHVRGKAAGNGPPDPCRHRGRRRGAPTDPEPRRRIGAGLRHLHRDRRGGQPHRHGRPGPEGFRHRRVRAVRPGVAADPGGPAAEPGVERPRGTRGRVLEGCRRRRRELPQPQPGRHGRESLRSNPEVMSGRFSFAGVLGDARPADPWTLLDQDLGSDTIPAFVDASVMTWGLGLELGDEIEYLDEAGRTLKVRLVASLAGSVFQGSLVVSESALLRHFPSTPLHRLMLVETPGGPECRRGGRPRAVARDPRGLGRIHGGPARQVQLGAEHLPRRLRPPRLAGHADRHARSRGRRLAERGRIARRTGTPQGRGLRRRPCSGSCWPNTCRRWGTASLSGCSPRSSRCTRPPGCRPRRFQWVRSPCRSARSSHPRCSVWSSPRQPRCGESCCRRCARSRPLAVSLRPSHVDGTTGRIYHGDAQNVEVRS